MKKTLLSIFLTVFAFIAFGQNLVLNGDFEDWTAGAADNWLADGGGITILQNTTTVENGSNSCEVTWTSQSNQYLTSDPFVVTPGIQIDASLWVYDDDAAGRARLCIIYDGANNYYGDYSVDQSSWQQLTRTEVVPAGAITAEFQIRFYDVSADWDGDANVIVDNVIFEANTSVDPEPTNYPTNFAATPSGTTITTTWTDDAAGAQLPIGYLILGDDGTGSTPPVDGTPVADDLDWSDGVVAMNILYGIETFSFPVDPNTSYNFTIYPYSNTGTSIDYKTDGTPPTASATSSNTMVISEEGFESDLGAWTGYSVIGDQEWEWANFGVPPGCAKMNGYASGAQINEDWLISPSIDLSGYTSVSFSFDHARNYASNAGLYVLVSNDYDGTSDPSTTGTWNDITSMFTFPDPGSWTFMAAGDVDVTTYNGASTYFAFKYTSTDTDASTWEVDNALVSGTAGSSNTYLAGSFNSWTSDDVDYLFTMNANGLLELTHNLPSGDNEYKVVQDGNWYPGDNQHIILSQSEDTTWKYNPTAHLVTHTLPVVAGDFLAELGGTNWDPTELIGEMEDPDGDDIYTLEVTIPTAGNYECKVTLNNNWNQSTGGNTPFTSDGINPTVFTYDFPNNTTTVSGPPPPAATVTFAVNDTLGKNYGGFYLKGSWDANGYYDPGWGGGMEHSMFYDDGTNGDTVAGDHIWMCEQVLTSDGGSNTWEWGVNDTSHNWIAGNWQFSVIDGTPFNLSWDVPDEPALVINEIMYNSPGTDEEWVELYNNTDASIDLENWRLIDEDPAHTAIVIPAGYSVAAGGYFTIAVATGGSFPFTPDYDGTGNFALNNGGDIVNLYNASNILVDVVAYSDSDPWPTEPDGDGPSLSLIDPDLDNSLAESWDASREDGGSPGAENFPPLPYVEVITPNGGEILEPGMPYEITWEYDLWDGNIQIDLLKEGEDPQLIVYNIPLSDGAYSWTVWNEIPEGNDYKILISGIDSGDPSDESDDYFSIIEPYIVPEIVITEIMYNPPEAGDDSLEFLEFYNNTLETVNLEGYFMSAGVEYTFPSIDILPDTFMLLAKDSAAMLATFGVVSHQWTGGALSNGGETVELSDNFGNVVDMVPFQDQMPWDTLADGHGPSLTLCNPDSDNAIPENWTASVNFMTVNSAGDSIWATPGFACQVSIFAGFEGVPTLVNVGDSVMFTDQTVGEPTTWLWTFEGGTPETFEGQTPPYIVYNTEGLWDVTLYVSDGLNSDELTYEDYIQVVDNPAPVNLQAEVGPFDDVQLTWSQQSPTEFSDDFESYEDFILEFLPWTNIDVDGSTTYGMTDIDWPNAYDPQAFIIFNPSQTTPAVEDIIPHSGDKLAACFASTTPPNNDWMITPMISVVDGASLDFWAKSYTDQYGLERFKVGVSTTGTDPADFTIISEGDYVEAPAEDWAEFTYDLSAYVGQSVYVGIQCVSNDAFILLVDDVTVGAAASKIVYNPPQTIIGKATRDISYTTKPGTLPSVTYPSARAIESELLGYNIYRDDLQLNDELIAETSYNDADPSIGSHEYYATAVYETGESEPSNVVTVVVTDINEISTNSVTVYPNPTDGMFTIRFIENVSVDLSLIDLTGKEVFAKTVTETSSFNVSDLQSGIYFLRILDKSSNTVNIKKLIIR